MSSLVSCAEGLKEELLKRLQQILKAMHGMSVGNAVQSSPSLIIYYSLTAAASSMDQIIIILSSIPAISVINF